MEPNREALEELFTAIMSTGVEHTNPTHGTLAGAIADELLIPNISETIRSGPDNLTGIQCGFETGSLRLIEKYADRKLAPYAPEEWHWVVKEGVKTLNENYWVPAFTLIMGPGQRRDARGLVGDHTADQRPGEGAARIHVYDDPADVRADRPARKVRVFQHWKRDGSGAAGRHVQDVAAQLQVRHTEVHDKDGQRQQRAQDVLQPHRKVRSAASRSARWSGMRGARAASTSLSSTG